MDGRVALRAQDPGAERPGEGADARRRGAPRRPRARPNPRVARGRTPAGAGAGRSGARAGALGRVGGLDPDAGSCRRGIRGPRGRRRRDRRPGRPPAARAPAVQPPANTASRRKSRRSGSDRRSWLQAIAPRSVRCRSGRSREPPARSRLDASRSRIRAGLSSRTRAAASSIASGSPDSRSQIWRTTTSDSPDRSRSGRSACARAVNSSTPASTSSGGTGWPRSPVIRRSSRLVIMSRTSGAPRATEATTSAPPGRSCSRLSRSSRADRSRRCSRRASARLRSGESMSPSVEAIVGSSMAASRTAARSTNHVPCGNRSRTACATPSARRVLPLPPGPVRVRIRVEASRSRSVWISSARPTSSVTSPGRLLGGSSVRSGRASSAAPATTSRCSRRGSSKSLTARSPSSATETSVGRGAVG